MVFLCAVLHAFAIILMMRLFYKMGKREGARREVRSMIELMESIKIDNWEQTVFRDRLVSALRWVLDGKRKKERDGSSGSPPPQA